jgi:hypothetical protein
MMKKEIKRCAANEKSWEKKKVNKWKVTGEKLGVVDLPEYYRIH